MAATASQREFQAHLRAYEENEKLPCSKDGCEQLRLGLNKLCEAHADELYEKRSAACRKAVETRRRNHPSWGAPGEAEVFRRWQARAQSAVAYAIAHGALPSLCSGEYACTDCGGVACEYDHRDYARPLDVEPVCSSCNKLRGTADWPKPGRYQFKKLVEPTGAAAPKRRKKAA